MIVDTSALAAILFDEHDKTRFATALTADDILTISAASWLELTIVLARRGRRDLIEPAEWLLNRLVIIVAAVSPTQAELARAAYLSFGKGSGHRARLNFGDCFAYALAKETGEPLLFKGEDFIHTDITPAL